MVPISVQLPLLLLKSAPFCQVFRRHTFKSTLADASNKICKPTISHTVDFNTTSLLLALLQETNFESMSCHCCSDLASPSLSTPAQLRTSPQWSGVHSPFVCWQRRGKSTPQLTKKGTKAFSGIRRFHTRSNESSVSQRGKTPLLCQERSSAAALLAVLPFILSELKLKSRCKSEIPPAASWERQHQTHSAGISGASNSLWDCRQAFCTKPEQPGTATPLESTCVPQPRLRGLHCLQCPSCETPGVCKHATDQGHLNTDWPVLPSLVVAPVSQKSPCPGHGNSAGTQPALSSSTASPAQAANRNQHTEPRVLCCLDQKVNSTFVPTKIASSGKGGRLPSFTAP